MSERDKNEYKFTDALVRVCSTRYIRGPLPKIEDTIAASTARPRAQRRRDERALRAKCPRIRSVDGVAKIREYVAPSNGAAFDRGPAMAQAIGNATRRGRGRIEIPKHVAYANEVVSS